MTALRVLFSLGLLLGLSALSHLPYGEQPSHGRLRLSWKTIGETQKLSAAPADPSAPSHMHNPESVEERFRDYRLTLTVDGVPTLDRTFSPPGLHRDRPISVFEEVDLPPGEHRIALRYWPVPEDGATWKPELHTTLTIEQGAITVLGLDSLPLQPGRQAQP